MEQLGNYVFEGPYASIDAIQERAGIYAIIDQYFFGEKILDIGESSGVKSRLLKHDRKNQWQSACKGNIVYAVMYTPNLNQEGRIRIEQELRNLFQPVCGER